MGLIDVLTEDEDRTTDSRRLGLVRAEVIDITDLTMQGRVQVSIHSLGIEPWATVCAPFAGDGYGLWCMPQVGDTVMVAFEGGDTTQPVVVGSVWGISQRPPIDQPLDAENKRILKTPRGHSLVFDDLEQKITITHAAGHELTMSVDGIELRIAQGGAALSLTVPGAASLEGTVTAEVSGKKTTVKGDVSLDLEAATTTVKADATCRISGSLVTIN